MLGELDSFVDGDFTGDVTGAELVDGDAEDVALEWSDSLEGPTFADVSGEGGVDRRLVVKRLQSERTSEVSRLIIEEILQGAAGQIVLVKRENRLFALV